MQLSRAHSLLDEHHADMTIDKPSKGSILVTGGSRGIGRACCLALADAGYETVSLSRTPPEQEPPEHGQRDTPHDTHYPVDLSDLDSTGRVVNSILKRHDIRGLICNAGRGDIGSLENFSSLQIQQSITMNLISPACIARLCLPTLRKQPRSNIVFIGSTSALQGARYGSLYSASKFGLRGLAQSLSHELSGANCHVGIVQPGMVRSDFFEHLDFEPGPEPAHALLTTDVARAALSMITSPDQAVVHELVVQPRQHVVQKRTQPKHRC